MSQSSPWQISSTSKFGLTSWSQASLPYFLGLLSSSISSRIDWLKLTALRLRLNDDDTHRPWLVITPSQQTFRNSLAFFFGSRQNEVENSVTLLFMSKGDRVGYFPQQFMLCKPLAFGYLSFIKFFFTSHFGWYKKLLCSLKLFLWLAPFEKKSTEKLVIFLIPYLGQ